MNYDVVTTGTLTLDPADWEGARALAHRMVDDAITRLQGLRDGPVWQPMPESVRSAFSAPVPTGPSPLKTVYAEVATKLYSHGQHPPPSCRAAVVLSGPFLSENAVLKALPIAFRRDVHVPS